MPDPARDGRLRAGARVPWALALSLEKRGKLRRMVRARDRGMIVVCDRFPQTEIPGFNDGPLLAHWRGHPSGLCRALAAWEARPYVEAASSSTPDLVMKLAVTPIVALARRPEMSFDEVVRRVRAVHRLRYPPTDDRRRDRRRRAIRAGHARGEAARVGRGMKADSRGVFRRRAVMRRVALSLLLGTAMLACMVDATCALTCAGRTGFALASVPPLAEPDYRQTVTEPAFGASITRVTDPGRPVPNLHTTWGAAARHRYSSAQAWNADQSLLMLGVGASGDLFLDGRTYTPLFRASPPGGCEWHPTDPRRMICVDGKSVLFWDPSGGTKAVVFSATDYHDLKFGPGKGNPSRDGRYVAVRGEDAAGGQVAFALDLERGVKFADIQLGALAGENSYVSISPTGHYVFVFQETPSGNQGHVFTRRGCRGAALARESPAGSRRHDDR